MTVSNEMIYTIGLILIGISVLLIAVFIPVFFLIGSRLKKRLEDDYGKNDRDNGGR